MSKVVFLLLVLASTSVAATRYVRSSATGGNNGSDWSNAYRQLPNTLVRGDTYYIACGSYPEYAFNTALSGSLTITIKAATNADHGTDVGWSPSFGVDSGCQAVFANRIQFFRGYVILDGAFRNGRKSGHGIKVDNNTSPQDKNDIELVADPNDVHNVTIRFVEAAGTGLDSPLKRRGINANSVPPATIQNLTIQFCYIHDLGNVPILTGRVNTVLLEHSTLERNSSDPVAHAEGISDVGSSNVTIRYNFFEDIEGTAQIVSRGGGIDNWDIHGNVFVYSQGNPYNREGNGDGAIAIIQNGIASNWRIYNNSFINLTQGLSARISFSQATVSNMTVFNNIWFSCVDAVHNGVLIANSNYYILTPHNGGEPNATSTPNTDPFVDWPGGNFRPKRATAPGLVLTSPPLIDMDATQRRRGMDGVWDRGAFEFQRPSPPTNLRPAP